jgi:hypothetical protein
VWSWLRWQAPPALLRVVIVNLISDPHTSLRGVLWESRGPWLVVREGEEIKRVGPETFERKPIDGDVLVHRGNVAFLQRLD